MKTFEIAPANEFVRTVKDTFQRYKAMGNNTFAQLDTPDFHFSPDKESNSIAVLIQHIHGNLCSRFSDFLTSDGEKPERERDKEFEETEMTKEELQVLWDEGFRVLEEALSELTEGDLSSIVFIRNEPHSVPEALVRSLAHIAYHVGQIVYLAKCIKGQEWNTLSIPKGKSKEYNRKIRKKK
ncbi:MAG: DUF1572 domain-containing protein [Bacteroidia bacterium]|nr:DUF1572 domain-containing protein [Bacteroidia bacterium]